MFFMVTHAYMKCIRQGMKEKQKVYQCSFPGIRKRDGEEMGLSKGPLAFSGVFLIFTKQVNLGSLVYLK